ncbi:MAG: outer membrane lipoprotein carrier protein LolA [Azoarcus sp.]|nr:outer membrane lipoprotein carrier protein LolA [Azoarcus sp.]
MKSLSALFFLLLSASVAHADWDVDQLMRALAANGAKRAAFTETRYLALLDQPLVVSGELVYVPPDRLERHATQPVEESMVLDGERLRLTREGKSHELGLRDYPEVAALIGAIRAALAGERAALERDYALSISGDRARWRLNLLPNNTALAQIVLRIDLSGSEGHIEGVDVLQADGDRSEMRIAPRQ